MQLREILLRPRSPGVPERPVHEHAPLLALPAAHLAQVTDHRPGPWWPPAHRQPLPDRQSQRGPGRGHESRARPGSRAAALLRPRPRPVLRPRRAPPHPEPRSAQLRNVRLDQDHQSSDQQQRHAERGHGKYRTPRLWWVSRRFASAFENFCSARGAARFTAAPGRIPEDPLGSPRRRDSRRDPGIERLSRPRDHLDDRVGRKRGRVDHQVVERRVVDVDVVEAPARTRRGRGRSGAARAPPFPRRSRRAGSPAALRRSTGPVEPHAEHAGVLTQHDRTAAAEDHDLGRSRPAGV